jgi:hypothetical protein
MEAADVQAGVEVEVEVAKAVAVPNANTANNVNVAFCITNALR